MKFSNLPLAIVFSAIFGGVDSLSVVLPFLPLSVVFRAVWKVKDPKSVCISLDPLALILRAVSVNDFS